MSLEDRYFYVRLAHRKRRYHGDARGWTWLSLLAWHERALIIILGK